MWALDWLTRWMRTLPRWEGPLGDKHALVVGIRCTGKTTLINALAPDGKWVNSLTEYDLEQPGRLCIDLALHKQSAFEALMIARHAGVSCVVETQSLRQLSPAARAQFPLVFAFSPEPVLEQLTGLSKQELERAFCQCGEYECLVWESGQPLCKYSVLRKNLLF